MKTIITSCTCIALLASSAVAQSAAEHLALGDREHAARNVTAALKHYEAALAVEPTNYQALIKAAHDAVDAGEFDTNEDQREALYKSALDYAHRAVAANPNDAESHFELARATGRRALTMGTRDKIKFAGEVRAQALETLKLSPNHPGALHILGLWNAEIMRLNGLSRMIAKNFLGGQVFGAASWDSAQVYLERSVAAEPARITHRLDLARVYRDRDDKAKARETYEWILKAPLVDANDAKYKSLAAQELGELR